ncbi:MAG: sigma-54-dependent transcriptional regulator [Planctomycetota bacterium]|nr:sigma-54 dependent transcriptional regulator [Planctomycetota bacterium]
MTAKILVVDDDPLVADSLAVFLRRRGYEVSVETDSRRALKHLKDAPDTDLLLTDVNMPGLDGFDLLKQARKVDENLVVVMLTGYGTIESAVKAMRQGAEDYVTKPILDEEMVLTVERALKRRRLTEENEALRRQLNRSLALENLIGSDHRIRKIYETLATVAQTRATVLITGESGTGKSMIARSIHHASPRRDKSFVEVNCGALPETLLESELFGHKRGAFTGADADRLGKFLRADGGTIFLDEISTASQGLQVKLLRILQERSFERVGGDEAVSVDVRVLLATNSNLRVDVEEGRFRADLFHRINVVSIDIPPLRTRPGDIPLLADHFLRRYCEENSKEVLEITDDAMVQLVDYEWPGNVRELENSIERAVVLCRSSELTLEDFPPEITNASELTGNGLQFRPDGRTVMPLKKALETPEKEIISATLASVNWNRQKAARLLDINRTTLFNKMRKYELLEIKRGGKRRPRPEGLKTED